MSRSKVFDHLIRIARIADYRETRGISTKEGSEHAAALELPRSERRAGRREFLKNMGKLAAVGAVGSAAGSLERAFAAQPSASRQRINRNFQGGYGERCYEL